MTWFCPRCHIRNTFYHNVETNWWTMFWPLEQNDVTEMTNTIRERNRTFSDCETDCESRVILVRPKRQIKN